MRQINIQFYVKSSVYEENKCSLYTEKSMWHSETAEAQKLHGSTI